MAADDSVLHASFELRINNLPFHIHLCLPRRAVDALTQTPPAADAPPEVLATWRKENGIPESHTGYFDKLSLPNGVVPGETDKPVLDSFAKLAHSKNWTPETYADAVGWYYATQDAEFKARAEGDTAYRKEATDALYKEWGGDFRANINAISNLTSKWPEGVADRLRDEGLGLEEPCPVFGGGGLHLLLAGDRHAAAFLGLRPCHPRVGLGLIGQAPVQVLQISPPAAAATGSLPPAQPSNVVLGGDPNVGVAGVPLRAMPPAGGQPPMPQAQPANPNPAAPQVNGPPARQEIANQ